MISRRISPRRTRSSFQAIASMCQEAMKVALEKASRSSSAQMRENPFATKLEKDASVSAPLHLFTGDFVDLEVNSVRISRSSARSSSMANVTSADWP